MKYLDSFVKNKTAILAFVLLCFLPTQTYGQFGNILNKVKEKTVEKVLNQTLPEIENNEATQDQEENDDAMTWEQSMGKVNKNSPIVFPVTGKKVNAIVLEYGMDHESDIKKMANTPNGKRVAEKARREGLKGSDEEILLELYANPQKISQTFKDQLETEEEEDSYDNSDTEETVPPSFLLAAFMGTPVYTFTADYIRGDLNKSENNTPSLLNMFGATPVTIIDLKNKTSYAIMNMFNTKAAIKSKINNSTNNIGFTDYFLKIQEATESKISQKNGQFEKYNCIIHTAEVPVKEQKDKDGKPDHTLYAVHQMLSGKWGAATGEPSYSPEQKLFIEACFSNDLNNRMPSAIKENMANAQKTPGLMVAYILRNEKGNEIIYKLKNIAWDQSIDEGQFILPKDYPVMTEEEYQKKVTSSFFKLENLLK